MEPVRSFRDLKVWQMGVELAPGIYRLAHALPPHEKYALGDQMRRAAISVPANIAEGHAQANTKSFLYHLRVSQGSLAELSTLLVVAERLNYLDASTMADARDRMDQLRRAMHGLTRSLKSKLTPHPSPLL